MTREPSHWIACLAAALVLGLGACDRRIEQLDPDERPAQPDLSKIFPPGADRAKPGPAGMPMPPGRAAPPVAEATAAAPIRGSLTLSSSLSDRVAPGAVLFLIARRGESGPPLAVKRVAAPSFPMDFELGPEDRMIQSLPFEGPLQLSARLDRDGNATSREPGDLQSSAPVAARPGDTGVELVIDSVL